MRTHWVMDYETLSNCFIAVFQDVKSDDTRTLAEVNGFELGLNLKVIDGGLPAVGRNAGAKLATTHYILFLDADSGVFPRSFHVWLNQPLIHRSFCDHNAQYIEKSQ